jgi:SAM-dependent methyltransferase
MSERWQTFVHGYVDRAGGPVPFALHQWEFLRPVYAAIRRALPSGGRVLDVGCGAGIFTALLAHHGFDVTGIDNDEDIVRYAAEMIDYLRAPAQVERGDAFDLAGYHDRFDLVYSLGVVEHFEPDVTVTLLREQARCAPRVLTVVPTAYTRYSADVTDERPYKRGEVVRMYEEAGLRVRESFVVGDVPTVLGAVMRRGLPTILRDPIERRASYGMGVCCLGEVLPAPPASSGGP